MTEGVESPGSQRDEAAAPQAGWHQELLDGLSSSRRAQAEVRALVLTASLADDAAVPDQWSDVDLTVVVADDAVARLISDRYWLEEQGRIVGLGRDEGTVGATLRVRSVPSRRVGICRVRASVARDALLGPAPAKCTGRNIGELAGA